MISKYSYKDLTWIDLEHPTEAEIAHLVDFKSEDALHFVVDNNTLITSRRYSTPEISTFAKSFEMNIALEKPVQGENIDLLFYELLGFFRQNSNNDQYRKILRQKDDEILKLRNFQSKILKMYKRKSAYLLGSLILSFILILYIFIWH